MSVGKIKSTRHTHTVDKVADPVSPDGIRLSQHIGMVIRGASYITSEQVDQLSEALPVVGRMAYSDDDMNYEEAKKSLEHISVVEEVQATANLLKLIRKNMSREESSADMDTIKAIQAINTALNTMNKMLPMLASANQLIKLQNALIDFGKKLPKDQRGAYMTAMREALRDEIED